MAKVKDIPEIQRFLTHERLDEIKKRLSKLPNGVYHPSSIDLMSCDALREDMEALIRHVEQADKENDLLIAHIEEIKNEQSSPGDR